MWLSRWWWGKESQLVHTALTSLACSILMHVKYTLTRFRCSVPCISQMHSTALACSCPTPRLHTHSCPTQQQPLATLHPTLYATTTTLLPATALLLHAALFSPHFLVLSCRHHRPQREGGVIQRGRDHGAWGWDARLVF